MFKFGNLKLKNRMLLYILSASVLTVGILVVYLSVRTHTIALQSSTEFIQAKTDENANKARILLEEGLNKARTVAFAMEGIKKSGNTNRETAIEIMHNVLERSPELLGIWTVWEPNAFDNADSSYVNLPGHDTTGRFIPYWNRGSGTIALEFCTDYTNTGEGGNYYFVPFNSDKEYVGEPYAYVLQGKNIMMTSIAVPIHYNGKVVGITGVDISVETIKQLQSASGLFTSGSASVISNKGMVVADNDSKLIGQKAAEFTDESKTEAKDAISNGKSLLIQNSDDSLLICYSPIMVGNTGTPWSFVSTVPRNEAVANARTNLYQSLVAGLAGILVLAVIVWFLADNISKHIIKGIAFAKEIAKGNLNAKLTFNQKDEIGELVQELNGMAATLKNIVSGLHQNADYIASVSIKLNSSSQELSEGSTEQASAAEEVASSMEEMASNIQQNAASAKETVKITMQAYDRLKEGTASGEIVGKSMNEIAGKISIIGDIAFQTNILALNAAVESARAGEHGRGFAVVASEVRKLAERSKVAADQINALSKKGLNVSVESGHKFESLIPEIEKTTRMIQEISAASMEQSSGADQINNALQQLNTVVQKNAATSEEISRSSEELLEMAEELKRNIGFFKI